MRVVGVEVVRQRCAGIDVSKRDGKVCVRVQGRGSTAKSSRVTTRSSSMPSILQLRDKLVAEGVELVVLESTSDYWRPFFYVKLTPSGGHVFTQVDRRARRSRPRAVSRR